ncbi:DeoR/GlpR family DNA-binding transcription regulator [Tropicimonas sp. TH_r6]|uniref:DeoR/GlpR family DNA-binding transcription regulator n=1 Tax=Tropicimonas sp. TH_r6 TaxID=3082085 RepID=UPI002953063A|nr:DeoR/GlpR family DNA-binding transcription regulator [Tropicimonas sp. TH_r6]MDV7141133.1 DeoR/GlpR family DNA-binding transcription regulator [Tropicimonas sp. TH_r6]
MKRDARRQEIMDMLVRDGSVVLEALAERFSVSKMTIHRDLDDLEQAGILRKMRGGATIEPGTQFESDFRFRERQGSEVKRRIARAALELVEPGSTVIVNDGSMAAVLGAMLVEARPITVITNNFAVMEALRNERGVTLIGLGGTYSPKYNGFFGLVTEESLFRLRADIAFISAPAVSKTTSYHMDDTVVRAKQAMMKVSERKCLLVGHQRFGHSALHAMADLRDFDAIVTDAPPKAPSLEELRDAGITLNIAKDQEE